MTVIAAITGSNHAKSKAANVHSVSILKKGVDPRQEKCAALGFFPILRGGGKTPHSENRLRTPKQADVTQMYGRGGPCGRPLAIGGRTLRRCHHQLSLVASAKRFASRAGAGASGSR
ncbi:MAG: hypothetical protein ACUVQQ_11540, partial [Thermogutta sp.]